MIIIALYSKNREKSTVIQLEQSSLHACAFGTNKIVMAITEQICRGSSKAYAVTNGENNISVTP
jgi:hypothetical protein